MALLVGAKASTAEPRLDLSQGWRFSPGDDPARSATAFDDSSWKPIAVGIPWEKAGYPGLDGFGWYRLRVTIPAKWKASPAIRDSSLLVLELGPVDDADETWFNGTKVGATGRMPPDYETAWDQPRAYRVPASIVKWGAENVIAVRVYDGQNEGGIYPGPVALRAATERDMVRASFEPAARDGIFPPMGRLEAKLVLENGSPRKIAGTLDCVWTDDLAAKPRVLSRKSEKVVIPEGGSISRSFTYKPVKPGFYPVTATLRLPEKQEIKAQLVLGYDPGKVEGPPAREKDFDSFWEARLGDLAAVDPGYTIEPKPELSTAKVDTYLVSMKSYGGVRIKGWLTIPKGKGPWPGLLSVAGYGGTMEPATGVDRAVVLALDIRGHGRSIEDINPGDGEYMYIGITGKPENYIYVGAYLDCVRGVDYLCTRSEVDKTRIGVEGGSQGGGLSLSTAGLDPRITACTADVPWLSDWPDYAVTAPWAVENFPKLLKENKGLTRARVMKVLSYIDAMNMAPRIKCPVMVSMGLVDDTCPPRTVISTYNRIRSPKTIRYYPHGGHEGGGSVHDEIRRRWLAEKLGVGN